MRMPGFTAETSLYRTSEYYNMGGTFGALAGGAEVVPQACTSLGPCTLCYSCSIFPPRCCVSVRCFGIPVFNRCIP
jgi:hypothetical protein